LERLRIPVISALPGVGQNLHDHLGVPVVFESTQDIPKSRYQATEVSLYRRGEDTSAHFDTQITMHQFAAYLPEDYSVAPPSFTFFPGFLKPSSRGSVTLDSADPFEQPRVDPGY